MSSTATRQDVEQLGRMYRALEALLDGTQEGFDLLAGGPMSEMSTLLQSMQISLDTRARARMAWPRERKHA